MTKIKVFEMFSGFGGATFAMKKAGIDFEVVGHSEIDKFAIQCYEQNHGNVKNYGDCTKIIPEELPDFDFLTGGFPCQSFSFAGEGKGINDARGLLFNDIVRILEVKRPKIILLENVKGLMSKTHKDFFEFTKQELERLGYFIDVRLYKSKEYGSPTKRERVFYVGMLGGLDYEPPEKKMFKGQIKDFLDHDVTEKISDERWERILRLNKTRYGTHIGLSTDNLHPTLMAVGKSDVLYMADLRRQLTPRECFRLMGFFNDEINIENLSNAQLYKLCGNGWDVNMVSQIVKSLLKDYVLCDK